MKASDKKMLKIIVAIAILILIAHQFGIITIPGLGRFETGGNGGNGDDDTTTATDRERWLKGEGMFEFYNSWKNSLAPATDLTTNELDVLLFTRYGGEWIAGPQLQGSTATKFEMKPEYGGFIWFLVQQHDSSDAYYIDYNKIVASDPYVVDYMYTDADEDNVKEFMFKYDMKGHSIPNSGYPAVWFYAYALPYDSSFTGLNDIANETAIGTTTTTKYKDYYLSFSAAAKAVAIYKVEVKVTTTDQTKIRLKHLEIPTLGNVPKSSFVETITASDIRWTYTFTSEFDGALYIQHATGANNRYDMQLELEFTLASSDDILVTLTVYYLIGPSEAGTSTSDTFYAQES